MMPTNSGTGYQSIDGGTLGFWITMSWLTYRWAWELVSKPFALNVNPWRICLSIALAIDFFRPPYAGSRKEPDLFVRPNTIRLPSFAVESGWSESRAELLSDMKLWLVGSAEMVKAVIILQWEKVKGTNIVRGDVELYSLDPNGMPICQQREVLLMIYPPLGL